MDTTSQTRSDAMTAGEFRLVAKPDETVHLVCCRDASWQVALCGTECTEINPAAEVVCTMCVEEVTALRPQWRSEAQFVCPVDATRCPDEHEVDLRIARETDRTRSGR
ncbi:hypothetical protein [Actinokineospora sp.]|uniref:hypothetical protein n=1 Tax=Actinokineospora sp. TaxID=1872133 RepID=UPI0040376ED5